MIRVLFVCLGNICRSPMAEAVFRRMVEEAGLSHQIEVDSAATSAWEVGNPVHSGTQKQLANVGISTTGMVARQLADTDLTYDYIVAMDQSNLQDIQDFVNHRPSGKVERLLVFAGEARDIKDPWYTGDFETTYVDVVKGCQALLATIKTALEESNNL